MVRQGSLVDGVVGLSAESPDQQMVAVPAHVGAGDQLILEARRLSDGLTLPMFSSVGALVSALGRFQPWAVLPLPRVNDLAASANVDFLVLDPEFTDDAWRWEEQDLAGFSWKVGK